MQWIPQRHLHRLPWRFLPRAVRVQQRVPRRVFECILQSSRLQLRHYVKKKERDPVVSQVKMKSVETDRPKNSPVQLKWSEGCLFSSFFMSTSKAYHGDIYEFHGRAVSSLMKSELEKCAVCHAKCITVGAPEIPIDKYGSRSFIVVALYGNDTINTRAMRMRVLPESVIRTGAAKTMVQLKRAVYNHDPTTHIPVSISIANEGHFIDLVFLLEREIQHRDITFASLYRIRGGPNARICRHCRVYGRFLKCGGCKRTYYCSKEHQRLHWITGHKEECETLKGL